MEAVALAAVGAVAIISILISIVMWVIVGLSHMKALRMLGYHTPWHAWIPVLRCMAFADAIKEGEEISIFGKPLPFQYFRFWWVLLVVADLIALKASTLGSILNIVVSVIFLGTIYGKMYARLENKPESEVQALGYVSGWLSIIAVVKFLLYKEN